MNILWLGIDTGKHGFVGATDSNGSHRYYQLPFVKGGHLDINEFEVLISHWQAEYDAIYCVIEQIFMQRATGNDTLNRNYYYILATFDICGFDELNKNWIGRKSRKLFTPETGALKYVTLPVQSWRKLLFGSGRITPFEKKRFKLVINKAKKRNRKIVAKRRKITNDKLRAISYCRNKLEIDTDNDNIAEALCLADLAIKLTKENS